MVWKWSYLYRMETFQDVIDLWPSRAALALDVDATPAQVSKWWQRDSVPGEWWAPIVLAARRRGHKISANQLAQIAARDRVA